jgi:F420-dependent oxidoreductase-like protein
MTYDVILRVWQEADAIPEIDHAWLGDHLLPRGIDADQPCLETWTLIAALAAQTERLRLGHLVTNVLNRNPAVLAKIAATVDLISGGRLVLGLGAGRAEVEQAAYGVPLRPPGERIGRLDEACAIARRLWTEDVVDFPGRYYQLEQARLEPKPVQRPHPPIVIGGMGEHRTLRVVARHADLWNMPGPPWSTVDDFRRLTRVLDDHCREIGRDPASVGRSVQLVVDRERPANTVATVRDPIAAGANHFVLYVQPPYEHGGVRWLVDTVIEPVGAATG